MDDLVFAVLGLIELGSLVLVHIFHSVARHAVDEPASLVAMALVATGG
jgi:hypothetical protein